MTFLQAKYGAKYYNLGQSHRLEKTIRKIAYEPTKER